MACSGWTTTVLAARRPTRRSSSEAWGGNTRIDGARHRARRHGRHHRPACADAPGHYQEGSRLMANDTTITVIGNLTADPELRFTQSGVAVASFTIASTPRKFNRQTGEWEDEEALFLRCSIWRDAAENVTESLEKGARVIAQGRLKQRSFTDREGNQRTSIELDVDEVGPSTKYAVAKPNKVQRNGGVQGGYQQAPQGNVPGYPQQGGYAPQPQQAPQQGNPWGGQPQQGQGAPQQWGGQPQGQPQQSPWAGQQAPQQPMPGVGDPGGPPF